MRTWVADLTGLAIGFALGGAAVLHFWPRIERIGRHAAPLAASAMGTTAPVRRLPTVVTPASPVVPPVPYPTRVSSPPPASALVLPAVSSPTTASAPVAPIDSSPAIPAPAPSAWPAGAPPAWPPAAPPPRQMVMAAPPPAALPRVVSPDQPNPAGPPHLPGHGVAGTGFFVADHLVMTAAHVVDGCRRTEILSPFLPATRVRIAARDRRHDIALLDVAQARAPATLAIGRPADDGGRVFILGYPAGAGPRVPQAAWGVLENDRLPPRPRALTNPREQIWLAAGAVTHGYSGGPIFDPRSGKVVGLVRASVDGRGLRGIRGMPTTGIAIGPGSALLDDVLQDAAPGTGAFPADQWGDDPLSVVRRATVHVYCWY